MVEPNPELEKHLENYGVGSREPTNPEYFSAVVKIAIEEFKIPITDITNKFGVSQPSVERWASGRNAPHVTMRPHVLEWILEKLS